MSYYYPAHLAETPGLSKCSHQPGSSCHCSAEVRQRDMLRSANTIAGQRDLKTQDVYRPNTDTRGKITDVYSSRGSTGPQTNVQGTTGQQPIPTYDPYQNQYYYPQVCLSKHDWCRLIILIIIPTVNIRKRLSRSRTVNRLLHILTFRTSQVVFVDQELLHSPTAIVQIWDM
jgi:hypothetical protein